MAELTKAGINKQLDELILASYKYASSLELGYARIEAFETYEVLRRLQRKGAATEMLKATNPLLIGEVIHPDVVKSAADYLDDGDLIITTDLYDESGGDLRVAMWLKELRRRRDGVAGGVEPSELSNLLEATSDVFSVLFDYPDQLVPINRNSSTIRSLRIAFNKATDAVKSTSKKD